MSGFSGWLSRGLLQKQTGLFRPLWIKFVFFGILFFTNQAFADFLPVPATKLAEELDHLTYFLVEISALASILVIGGFVYLSLIFCENEWKNKQSPLSPAKRPQHLFPPKNKSADPVLQPI